MLTSLSEMRSRARQSLKGHWGEAALITFVYFVITMAISGITSLIPLLGIFSFATVIFQSSYYVSLYRTHRGSDVHDKFFELLFDLKDDKWWKYLLFPLVWVIPMVILFIVLFVIYFAALYAADLIDINALSYGAKDLAALSECVLALIPFVIIFLVVALYVGYGMYLIPYIVFDHPELGCMDTVRRSWFMMKGHKMKLFLLHLSFIGWDILSLITFCILQLWITPYKLTATAEFYLQIKAEHGELGDKVIYEEDIVAVEAEEIG